jgi:membrane protein YqaA with SNARE-associated domain
MTVLATIYFYFCSTFSGAVMGWEIGRMVDKALARRRYRRMSLFGKLTFHVNEIGNAIAVRYGKAGLIAATLVLALAIVGLVAMVR